MRKIYLILLCFLPILLAAQNQISHTKTLEKLIDVCENVKTKDNYKQLITKATEGISASKNNLYFSARFYFYKAYGYEYDNNRYAEAIPFYEKSWSFAKKGKNLKEETMAIMRLNYLYYSTKQFKKRNSLISYIKTILDTTKNVYSQGILNGSLGEYYLDNSEIEQFIGYKLKAIDYRKKFPKDVPYNVINIGISYSQIGQAYIKMRQYNKGIEYSNFAKPHLKESNNSLAFLYNDYIKCYVGLKNSDSIKKYYNSIYKLISEEDPLYISISSANRFMAEYYIDKKQINTASGFAEKALFFGKKSNDEVALMEANLSKGKILFEQKKYPEAIQILKKAAINAYEFDKSAFITIHKLIAESSSKLGNWEEAYKHHDIYAAANENLLNESAKQSIANAEARFQNKHKQERINFLSTENKVKNLEIENTRRKQIYLGVGALLLLVIAALLYKQNVGRRKSNEKLQVLNQELDIANKTKARFFSIINHDLRSPVANLIHFLHLQRDNPELLDAENKLRLESKTISGVENLLSSMEDLLLWSKGQMENFNPQWQKIAVSTIFEDTQKHFSNFDDVAFVFQNEENISLYTDENYLKTIIRNLTGNAIKALQNTPNAQIIWKAYTNKDGKTNLAISDNGPGGNKEQFRALYDDTHVTGIKTGLGLHLIRDLARAIDCEISMETQENKGTTFVLCLNSI
jgi:signal transduction histidine kinase